MPSPKSISACSLQQNPPPRRLFQASDIALRLRVNSFHLGNQQKSSVEVRPHHCSHKLGAKTYPDNPDTSLASKDPPSLRTVKKSQRDIDRTVRGPNSDVFFTNAFIIIIRGSVLSRYRANWNQNTRGFHQNKPKLWVASAFNVRRLLERCLPCLPNWGLLKNTGEHASLQ